MIGRVIKTIGVAGMYPMTYIVRRVENGKAYVTHDYSEYGTWMPVESVDHFEADLNGTVPPSVRRARRSSNPAVNAVIEGKGEFLGKGDDGIVWRVGDVVVKASTPVPYQPMNPGHRTPREAMAMMQAQWDIGQKLRSRGVPHLPPSQLVQVADKLFEVKPLYRILDKLTKNELDQITDTVGAMHHAGYILGDTIQVGVDNSGYVWFYDIGKIQKGVARSNSIYDDFKTEIDGLRRLYKDNGVMFEPPPGYILNEVWKDILKRYPPYAYTYRQLNELNQLEPAAVRAGIPNASRDADSMRKYIQAALKQYKED